MNKFYHVLITLQEPLKRRISLTDLCQAFKYFFYFRTPPEEIKLVWKDSPQSQRPCGSSVTSKPFLTEMPRTLNFVRSFSNRNGKIKISKSNVYIKMSSDKYHLMTSSIKKKTKHEEKLILKLKKINMDSNKAKKTDSKQRIVDIFYNEKSKININKIKQHGKNVYETLLGKFSLSNIHSLDKNPKKMSTMNSPLKKNKPIQNTIPIVSSKNEVFPEENIIDNKHCASEKALDVKTSQQKTMEGSINVKVNNTTLIGMKEESKDVIAVNSKLKSFERDDRTQRKRYREKTNSFIMSKENNNISKAAKSKMFKKYQPELDYRLKKLAEKYTKTGMAKALRHFQNELANKPVGVMKKSFKEEQTSRNIGIKQKVLKRELKKKLVMDVTKQVPQTNSFITTIPKPSLSDLSTKTQILLRDIPNAAKKTSKLDCTILTLDLKGTTEIQTQTHNPPSTPIETALSQQTINTQKNSEIHNKELKLNQDKLSNPIILDLKNVNSIDTLIKSNENKTIDNTSDKKYAYKTALVLNIVGRKSTHAIPSSNAMDSTEKENNELKQNSFSTEHLDKKRSFVIQKDLEALKLNQKERCTKENVEKTFITAEKNPQGVLDSNKSDQKSTISEKSCFQVAHSNEIDQYIIHLDSHNKITKESEYAIKKDVKKELITDDFQNLKEKRPENVTHSALIDYNAKTKSRNEGCKHFEDISENKDQTVSFSKLVHKLKSIEFIAKEVGYKRNDQPDNDPKCMDTKLGKSNLISENKYMEGILKATDTTKQDPTKSQEQKPCLNIAKPVISQNSGSDMKAKQMDAKYSYKNISNNLNILKTDKTKSFEHSSLYNRHDRVSCSKSSLQGQITCKTNKHLMNRKETIDFQKYGPSNKMVTKNIQSSKENLNSAHSSKNHYLTGKDKTDNKIDIKKQCKLPTNSLVLQVKIKNDLKDASLKSSLPITEKSKHLKKKIVSESVGLKNTFAGNVSAKTGPESPKKETKSIINVPIPNKKENLVNEMYKTNQPNKDSKEKKNYKAVKSCNITGFLVPCSNLREEIENKKVEDALNLKCSEIPTKLKPIIKIGDLPLIQRTFLFPKANNIFLISTFQNVNIDKQNIVECLKQCKDIGIQDIVNVNPQLIINYFPPEMFKNTDVLKKFTNSHLFMLVVTKEGMNQNQFRHFLEQISKYTSQSRKSYSIFCDFSIPPTVHKSWHDLNDLYGLGNIFLMNGLNKVSFHKFIKPPSIDLKVKAREKNRKENKIESINGTNFVITKEKSLSDFKEHCSAITMSKPLSKSDKSYSIQKCLEEIKELKPKANKISSESSFLENENKSLSVRCKPNVSDEKVLKNPNIIDSKKMSSYTKFTEFPGKEQKLIERMQTSGIYDSTFKVYPKNKNELYEINKSIKHNNPTTFREIVTIMKADSDVLNKSKIKLNLIKIQNLFEEVKSSHRLKNNLSTIPPRNVSNNSVADPSKSKNTCFLNENNVSIPTENNFLNQNNNEKIHETSKTNSNYEKTENEPSNILINYKQAPIQHDIHVSSTKYTSLQNSKNDEDTIKNYINKLKNMSVCEEKNPLSLSKNNDSKYSKNVSTSSSYSAVKSGNCKACSPTRVMTEFENCSQKSLANKTFNQDQIKDKILNPSSSKNTSISEKVDTLKAIKYQQLNDDISKKFTENKACGDNSSINNHYGASNDMPKVGSNMTYIDKKYFTNLGKELRTNDNLPSKNIISKPKSIHSSSKVLRKNMVYVEEQEKVMDSEDPYLKINKNSQTGDNAHVLQIKASSKEEEGDTSILLNIKYLVNKSRKSISEMPNYDNIEPSTGNSLQMVKKLEPTKIKVYDQIKYIKSNNFKNIVAHIKQKDRISRVHDIIKIKKPGSFKELTDVIKNNFDEKLEEKRINQNLQTNEENKFPNIPEITTISPTNNKQHENFIGKNDLLEGSPKMNLEENKYRNESKSKLEFKEVPTSMILFIDIDKESKLKEEKNTLTKPCTSECKESKKSSDTKGVKISLTEKEQTSEDFSSKLNDSSIEIAKRVEELLRRKRRSLPEKQSTQENKILTDKPKQLDNQINMSVNNQVMKTDSTFSKKIVPVKNSIQNVNTAVMKRPETTCSLDRKITARDQTYMKQAQRPTSVLNELPSIKSPLMLPKVVPTEDKADSCKNIVNKEDITGSNIMKSKLEGIIDKFNSQDNSKKLSIRKPEKLDFIFESVENKRDSRSLRQIEVVSNNKTGQKSDIKNELQPVTTDHYPPITSEITLTELDIDSKADKIKSLNLLPLEKNQNRSEDTKVKGNCSTRDLTIGNVHEEKNIMDKLRTKTKVPNEGELQINLQSLNKTDQVPSPSRFLKEKSGNGFKEEDLISFSFSETQNDSKALTVKNEIFIRKEIEGKIKNASEQALNAGKMSSSNYSLATFDNGKTKTDIRVNKSDSTQDYSIISKIRKDTHHKTPNKMFFNSKSSNISRTDIFVDYSRENYNKKKQKVIQTSKGEEYLQRGKLSFNNPRSKKMWNKSTPTENSRKRKMIHSETNEVCDSILNGPSNIRCNRRSSLPSFSTNLERNTQERTKSLDRFGDSLQSKDELFINNVFECVPLHCLGLPNTSGNEGFLSKRIRSESSTDPSSFLFNGNSQKNKKRDVTPEAIKFKISKYRHNKKEDKDVRTKKAEIKVARGSKTSSISSHLLTSPSLSKAKKDVSSHNKNNMNANKNRKKITSSVKILTTRSKYCLNNAEINFRKTKLPISQFACTTPSTVVHKARVEMSKLKRKHNAHPPSIFEANSQQNDSLNKETAIDKNNEIITNKYETMIETPKNPPLKNKTDKESKRKITQSKSCSYIEQIRTPGSLLFEKPVTKQLFSSEPSVKPFEDPEMIQNKECYHISNEPIICEAYNTNNKINILHKSTPNLSKNRSKNSRKGAELTSLMGSVVTNVKTKLQGIPSSMSKLMSHSQSNKSWVTISDIVKNKVLEDFTISNFQKKLKNLQVGMLQSTKNNTKYFVLGKMGDRLPENDGKKIMKVTQGHSAQDVLKKNNQNISIKNNMHKKQIKKTKKKRKVEKMLQIEAKGILSDKKRTTPHLAYSDLLNKLYVKYLNSQTKGVLFSEKVS